MYSMVWNKRKRRFSHRAFIIVFFPTSYLKELKMLVFLFIWIRTWQIKWKQITKMHSNCRIICIFFFQLYCTISKLILTSLEIMKNIFRMKMLTFRIKMKKFRIKMIIFKIKKRKKLVYPTHITKNLQNQFKKNLIISLQMIKKLLKK